MDHIQREESMRTVFTAAVAACALMTASAALAQEEYPELSLRWAHFAPNTWGAAQAEEKFAEILSEKSGGKIKVQFFWSGSLGGAGELMELGQSGAVDVVSFVPTYHPAQWPLIGLTNSLPMTFKDPITAMNAQDYQIKNNPAVQAEIAGNGLKLLQIHGLEPYRLQCTSPIETLEDLKGKRIRSFGEWPPYVLNELGAVPVNITLTEMYEALQRGTLDCAYNSYENAGFMKLSEVAPHFSDISFGSIAAYSVFTSIDTWNSWPESVQKLFTETYEEAKAYEMGRFKELNDFWIDDAVKNGAKLVTFKDQDKLDAMFPDMLALWEKSTCDKGLCEEAKSVVADTRKIIESSAQ
ncbi:hypothetical protein DTW92_10230 [Paracoccus pantotrophus]|nr:hypothetical protein DTW92_10230 [Paracoccus pantotrophus]WGR66588.1 hypothetical protein E3U24_14860 [Paracoccus pantotrophus]